VQVAERSENALYCGWMELNTLPYYLLTAR